MRSERGQATVEWTGLLLLVALALLALSQLAPKADGSELGTTLAHSVTGAAASAPGVGQKSRSESEFSGTHPARTPVAAVVPRPRALPALPRVPESLRRVPESLRRVPESLRRVPESLRRARRGAGALWRRAWFACLVYQRTRYALRHPEISVPGYTLPYGTALRMINGCVSPVDLLHDIPELDPAP